jgi:site-specific recombinase XerD
MPTPQLYPHSIVLKIHYRLRHQAITEMAEAGATDATIMAVAGHLDRAMMEHYAHVRMTAKRDVLNKVSSRLQEPQVRPEKVS